jgi:hypothetical protein
VRAPARARRAPWAARAWASACPQAAVRTNTTAGALSGCCDTTRHAAGCAGKKGKRIAPCARSAPALPPRPSRQPAPARAPAMAHARRAAWAARAWAWACPQAAGKGRVRQTHKERRCSDGLSVPRKKRVSAALVVSKQR